MKRLPFILTLALVGITAALAHDPYEITSVVYLQSNRIELFVEMEFPTGMTLAGRKPLREVAAASQFAAALPQLEKLAGSFFEITAGNHVLLPLGANVQLGVEDHLQCKVQFAPTDYRPLRFAPRGLRGAEDFHYGVSLTVLDMVNRRVLGQATLFADSPAVDFPAGDASLSPTPLAKPMLAVTQPDGQLVAAASATNLPPPAAAADQPSRSGSLRAMTILVVVGILLIVSRWRKARA